MDDNDLVGKVLINYKSPGLKIENDTAIVKRVDIQPANMKDLTIENRGG